MSTEPVEFRVKLSSLWHNEAPKYTVLIDDEVIDQGELTELREKNEQRVVHFTRDLTEGDHVLRIRLTGKNGIKHTVLNESNEIIKDQLLYIDDIDIDDIELGQMIYKHSKWFMQARYNKGEYFYEENPEPEPTSCLGFNSEYRMKFSVPTYMWFLEVL
jgi:hypothetical protein